MKGLFVCIFLLLFVGELQSALNGPYGQSDQFMNDAQLYPNDPLRRLEVHRVLNARSRTIPATDQLEEVLIDADIQTWPKPKGLTIQIFCQATPQTCRQPEYHGLRVGVFYYNDEGKLELHRKIFFYRNADYQPVPRPRAPPAKVVRLSIPSGDYQWDEPLTPAVSEAWDNEHYIKWKIVLRLHGLSNKSTEYQIRTLLKY